MHGDDDDEDYAMKMPRIERRVSWGQIGSTVVVLTTGLISLCGGVWWMSDYMRGLNDNLSLVNQSLTEILVSTKTDHAAIGTMQGQLDLLQQRWTGIEADYAAAPQRRTEFLAKLDVVLGELRKQMSNTQDKLQGEIDSIDGKTVDLARAQQQMAMDIARFKCRVFPKNCDQTP